MSSCGTNWDWTRGAPAGMKPGSFTPWRRRITGCAGPAEADLAAAIRRAREAYQEKPQEWNNTLNLAVYHLAAGAADEAERLYREAIAGGAPVGALREALRDLDDLLALFPAHPQAQAMRDLLAAHLGRSE
jgi:6-phosphogluconate dehydrogenase